MSSIDEIEVLLLDNNIFNNLPQVTQRGILENIKNKTIDISNIILDYKIYELLLLDGLNKKEDLIKALGSNIINIFKETNKYEFDLVILFLNSTNYIFLEGDNDFFILNKDSMSYVSKELLFKLDDKESVKDVIYTNFLKSFDIKGMVEQLKGDNNKIK